MAKEREIHEIAMWQPIESCPKEQDVLLFSDMWEDTFGAIQIGQLDHGGEWNLQSEMRLDDDEEFFPTHWMPLPAWPAHDVG